MEQFVNEFIRNVLSVYQTDPLLVIGTILFSVSWFGLLGFIELRAKSDFKRKSYRRWRAIPGIHHEKSRAYRVLPDRSAFKLDALCLAFALMGLAVGFWLYLWMPTAEPALKLGTVAGLSLLGFQLPRQLIQRHRQSRRRRTLCELGHVVSLLRVLPDLNLEGSLRTVRHWLRGDVASAVGRALDRSAAGAECMEALEPELRGFDVPEMAAFISVLRQWDQRPRARASSLQVLAESIFQERLEHSPCTTLYATMALYVGALGMVTAYLWLWRAAP
jgi:pilus assembly protein TadC